jgi:CelD/BcsL family acetyltransferase involved in cellulose biosynthesis
MAMAGTVFGARRRLELKVRVADTAEGVEGIVPAWRDLASRSGISAFGFPFWATRCLGTDGGFTRPRPRIVTVWSGDELVALGPFAEELRAAMRKVRFLGPPWAQPNRPLVAPGHEDAVPLVWRALHGPRTVLRLHDLDLRVSATPLDPDGSWSARVERRSRCWMVDTSIDLDERLRRDHRKLRSVLVARERITSAGLSVEHRLARTPGEVAEVLPALTAIQRASGADHAPSSMERDFGAGRLPRLLAAAAAEGRLLVFVLSADGVPFSHMIALLGDRVVSALMTAHHRDYRELNPGHLVFADLYAWAHEQGIPVDFSVGDLQWKRCWSREGYEVVDLTAAANGLVLRTLEAAGRARSWLRAAGPAGGGDAA